MLQPILIAYGIAPGTNTIQPFGSGLINHTWKVSGSSGEYILQRINNHIFKRPQDIAANLQALDEYLKLNSPGYLFPAPLPSENGDYLVENNGKWYRLLPFIKGSHTVDFLTEQCQAYQAAAQFGKFTRMLSGFEVLNLKYTLPDFHNLDLRIQQFQTALAQADAKRMMVAQAEIELVNQNIGIAETYRDIVIAQTLPLRVIHHDTKINNVLFDEEDKGLAVIDLDTVMPGYFISDVGDMMRTYLSEANEEEQDLDKIAVRVNFFDAICAGYLDQMGSIMTAKEKELFIYSGKFMIYMQAVRFLTDFLNGDVYYQTKHPGHNLVRAKNQLRLLELYTAAKPQFEAIIDRHTY